MNNPWHEVKSRPGNDPGVVNGIIEIPKGTRAKYELDKESGLLRLDRVLYSSVYYPANYGFIPRTLDGDNDPLDILVLCQIDLNPLSLVQAQVVGVMRMLDQGETDDKILAVAANDVGFNYMTDIAELPPHFTKELRAFFEDYKRLENKTTVVEDFLGRAIALEIIQRAEGLYQKSFPGK